VTIPQDPGLRDPAGVLLHALLADPGPTYAARWRAVLGTGFGDSPRGREDCFAHHLKEALAGAADEKGLERLGELVEIAVEAGNHRAVATSGALSPDLVVKTFPRLVAAYVRVPDARVGEVCRRVGWDAVLAAAPTLLAEGGALAGPDGALALSDPTVDVLPLAAVLVKSRDPGHVARAVRAMRKLPLAPAAEALLRALPVERLTEPLLVQVCVEGFRGNVSATFLSSAVRAIEAYLEDPAFLHDSSGRSLATAALVAFPSALAKPVLARRLRRRFLVRHVEPFPVRRSARLALDALSERSS
jgi:hypothetical protein